jgi:hypothetical protein
LPDGLSGIFCTRGLDRPNQSEVASKFRFCAHAAAAVFSLELESCRAPGAHRQCREIHKAAGFAFGFNPPCALRHQSCGFAAEPAAAASFAISVSVSLLLPAIPTAPTTSPLTSTGIPPRSDMMPAVTKAVRP